MPKKVYDDVPRGYPVCLHADCPQAATCLHQIAYDKLLKQSTMLYLINPTQCMPDKQCAHYRSSAPVVYARGFTGMLKRMYPEQFHVFKSTLVQAFGQNPYYERRRGDSLLTPDEQQTVMKALQRAGVSEKLDFDCYEEHILWDD